MRIGFEDWRVVCPFYDRDNGAAVECEGPSEGERIGVCFASPAKKGAYKTRYCRDMETWQSCPVARMLADRDRSDE